MENNKKDKLIVLAILDGWGIAPHNRGNAITLAKTPNVDSLCKKYPNTQLFACGHFVGLPDMIEGNSEAGHLNLGAGRLVKQDAVFINESIKDGTFYKNPAFLEAIKHVKKFNSSLHLMGLLSNHGSAHSQPEHIFELLKIIHSHNIQNIYLHIFTDGRDSSPHSAYEYIEELRKHFLGNERIVTVIGRFYAMDRTKNWARTKRAYDALVSCEGRKVKGARDAIIQAYNRGETDEFISPSVVCHKQKPLGNIKDNDAIIFFNLRSDRARQLTKTFVQPDFEKNNHGTFERKKKPKNLKFVAMTDFGPDLPGISTAYPSRDVKKSLPMVLKDQKQLYIAEKEKFAHVTYFFNGGYADPVAGEDRIMIPSPLVDSYDKTPEMKARELTKKIINDLNKNKYSFVTVNYCNPDMIGHTGNLRAGIRCVEIVDDCVGKLYSQIIKQDGILIVTSDHGNVEEMINLKTGEIDTRHSKNPVPFILAGKKFKSIMKLKKEESLSSVAPTILDIFDINQPKEMKGETLI